MDTWHRPLQKAWGYAFYAIAVLLGFGVVIAVVRNAEASSWLGVGLSVLVGAPIVALGWRVAGLGVYVNAGGIRIVRIFDTSVYSWSEISGFTAVGQELAVTLVTGAAIGTGIAKGYTGRLVDRRMNALRFESLLAELADAQARYQPAASAATSAPAALAGASPHWLEPYLPAEPTAPSSVSPHSPAAPASGEAPTRDQNRAMALIVVLPIVVVAIIAGVVVTVLADRRDPSPSQAPTAPPLPYTMDYFTLPASAGGLAATANKPLNDDAQSAAAVVERQFIDLPAIVGAYQSQHDPDDAYLLIGVPTKIDDPATAATQTIDALARDDDFAIDPPKTYATGAGGGVMLCASATESAEIVPRSSSICVVADPGGLVIGIYESHSGAADATITAAVRPEFEK